MRRPPREMRDQAEAVLAAFFAQSHADAVRLTATSPSIGDELPGARIKRIMKQDACDPVPRMISVESIPLMSYACALFIGSLSDLAWRISAKPNGRNTLQLKDLVIAAQSSRHFDFLIDVLDASEQEQSETAPSSAPCVPVDKLPDPGLPPEMMGAIRGREGEQIFGLPQMTNAMIHGREGEQIYGLPPQMTNTTFYVKEGEQIHGLPPQKATTIRGREGEQIFGLPPQMPNREDQQNFRLL